MIDINIIHKQWKSTRFQFVSYKYDSIKNHQRLYKQLQVIIWDNIDYLNRLNWYTWLKINMKAVSHLVCFKTNIVSQQ